MMNTYNRRAFALQFLIALLTASSAVHAGTCTPSWSDDFGLALIFDVRCMLTANEGGQEVMYIGGKFFEATGVPAKGIVRWDGQTWSPLTTGVAGGDGQVSALAKFGIGNGAPLYVAGSFASAGGVATNSIARWNGSAWSSVAGGTNEGGVIYALREFDDGSGPALFAGGSFTQIGGVSALNIAKWNGSTWSPVGSGVNATVRALEVFDDGLGPALFVGGDFTMASGVTVNRIARWNGSTWEALVTGLNAPVWALTVHDDGLIGQRLYVGGDFTLAGSLIVRRVARWDGRTWSALGEGFSGGSTTFVTSFAKFHVNGVTNLCAGGVFANAGGAPAKNVARWNGTSWAALGNGMGAGISALANFNDGTGPALYGLSGTLEGGSSDGSVFTRWSGQHWQTVGKGFNGLLQAFAVYDDGSGPALYVAGEFTIGGGISASAIIKWDGQQWSRLPGQFTGGSNNRIYDMVVFNGNLYIACDSRFIGNLQINCAAKWNGQAWSTLGGGITSPSTGLAAYDVAIYDDGTGPALFYAGDFPTAGGITVNNIAKWNGSNWSALASGLNDDCIALATHETGQGEVLVAGGYFSNSGSTPAYHIARWNGSAWTGMATSSQFGVGGCTALISFDNGSGPILYAGGNFALSPGGSKGVAKWNGGTSWSPVPGLGQTGLCCDVHVNSFAVFDDLTGGGPQLHATGEFITANGQPVNKVTKWNGSSWLPLAGGISGNGGGGWPEVAEVIDLDDGTGPTLYIGGRFATANGKSSSRIALWQRQAPNITQDPSNIAVDVGESVQLSVKADGVGDLSYQWRRDGFDLVDGVNISGATTSTLSILSASASDEGQYRAIVADDCGSAITEEAQLAVDLCPSDISPSVGNDTVDVDDLMQVIVQWGQCVVCTADVSPPGGDKVVGVDDLIAVIASWGECPQ